jgi:hypothetical protein
MRTNRLLLVMSFAGVVLAGTSLYAQQDADPTWYDPCPEPAKVTTPSQVAQHVNQPKTVAGLLERQPGEQRAKRLASQQAGSRIAGDHRTRISSQQQSPAANAPSSSLKRGAVPAARTADETAAPIATETVYEVKPIEEAARK